MQRKIININSLKQLRTKFKNKKIVHCHGVFDLFHHGHLMYLKSAKKNGDILIVSITADKYVNKGPGRPRFNQAERSHILSSLDIVDYVFVNDNPTADNIFPILKPDYYVKGKDYFVKKNDRSGGIFLEEKSLKKYNGKLIITEDRLESSTTLINSFFNNLSKEQEKIVKDIKKKYSIDYIFEIIENLKKLKVFLIGEPIIDTYIFCKPMSISSKSPSISTRFEKEENYSGGSLAVAKNLAELGCSINISFCCGAEEFNNESISEIQKHKNIHSIILKNKEFFTPRKTRFIDPFKNQRMFEIVNIPEIEINNVKFLNKIKQSNKYIKNSDLIMITDFGHGLINEEIINYLSTKKKYTAINIQTNSENFGFNLFSKYKKFDYMSIDEKECRLGMHDRRTDIKLLAKKLQKNYKKKLSVTLGDRGSLCMSNTNTTNCPNFYTNTIDTTGAGDAYFAITSLLSKLHNDTLLISFIGNIYAGLATQIIGNKDHVTKISLIKSIKSILG
jgi:rfaE bifunctional protein nucleotidyltransferase chain/domain